MRNTGYLVSRLGHYATRRFGERMAGLGLTSRMWGALNVIEADDGITQQQLGRAIGMDPSSMVATIDELESLRFVQRLPHPSDRRAHALHVTDKGRDALARGRRLSRAAQDELLAPLSDEERAQLHELLLRLALAAGAVGGESPATGGGASAPGHPTRAADGRPQAARERRRAPAPDRPAT